MEVVSLAILTIFVSESIAGILINLFILVSNFMKWKALKSLHLGDKILSVLATSRCLFLFIFVLSYLFLVFDLWNNKKLLDMSTLLVVTMFLHSTNLWFATVLCVFYCVKITSYNWKFFIFLKTKISTMILWFILASLLISVSFGLTFGWFIYGIQMKNVTDTSEENRTLSRAVLHENSQNFFLLNLTGSSPPFMIFLVADYLLVHSLWMHTRQMRSSRSGFRSPNLETHFSAVKSMSFFFVLQIIYFCMAVYSSAIEQKNSISFWITSVVVSSPPSLHSLYIISSNSELKNRIISMFDIFKCCAQENIF